MSRFLIGLWLLSFVVYFASTVTAQQSTKMNNEQTTSEEKAGIAEGQQPTTSAQSFNALAVKGPGGTAKPVDANPSSKEKILGMDPTIALVVVFSVFLVLVTVIIAVSGDRGSKD